MQDAMTTDVTNDFYMESIDYLHIILALRIRTLAWCEHLNLIPKLSSASKNVLVKFYSDNIRV